MEDHDYESAALKKLRQLHKGGGLLIPTPYRVDNGEPIVGVSDGSVGIRDVRMVEVAELDGPDERGKVTAIGADGTRCRGNPSALLRRLTEHLAG